MTGDLLLEILVGALYVALGLFILWLGVLILLLPLWGIGQVFGITALTKLPGAWADLPREVVGRLGERLDRLG